MGGMIEVTMMQPHYLVDKQAVSPSMCYDAAPVYGSSSNHQELAVAPGDIAENAPAAPAEGIVEEGDKAAGKAAEDAEGEVRKPTIWKKTFVADKGGDRGTLSPTLEIQIVVPPLPSRQGQA